MHTLSCLNWRCQTIDIWFQKHDTFYVKSVEIYTDGACSNNPGDGGWGAILFFGGIQKELSGFEKNTTNNRMELLAAIKSLEALKEPCKVKLYSDSAYLCNAFLNRWIDSWQKNNWKSSSGAVKNQDLWEALLKQTSKHSVSFIKVKGHSDNEFNNRADSLATNEIAKSRGQ